MPFFCTEMYTNSDVEDEYDYDANVDNYVALCAEQEIPELIFLPDNPIIKELKEIERNESSKLNQEQWDKLNWNKCVENMFRIILEKQINKLIEFYLPKDLMDQVIFLKDSFEAAIKVYKDISGLMFQRKLYNICKQICKLEAQYYS